MKATNTYKVVAAASLSCEPWGR